MEEEEIKQLSRGLGKMGAEVIVEVLEEVIVRNWNMPLKTVLAATRMRNVATLGGWTEDDVATTRDQLKAVINETYIEPRMFLLFACCLDLIPPERQKVAATMWTGRCPPEVLAQIQHELTSGPNGGLDPSSDTCWWLAARRYSSGIRRHVVTFREHLESFGGWMENKGERLFSAVQALGDLHTFTVIDGVAFVDDAPRCRHPYYFGHTFMVGFDRDLNVFTLATYRDSLGLEAFSFSEECADDGERLSGLVDGSPQYARLHSFEELADAIKVVRGKLG